MAGVATWAASPAAAGPAPPAAVLAVDWSGWLAAAALCSAWGGGRGRGRPAGQARPPATPAVVFLNYRVFTHSACSPDGCPLSAPVRAAEADAVAGAAAAVALCAADAADLAALAAGGPAPPPPAPLAVVLPALRPEFAALPPPATPPLSPHRTLLLCCVRLAPEKEPGRFAEVVERLAASGALARHGVVPAVVGGGPAGDPSAAAVRARVTAACPAALILPGFLGPPALAALYERTALNFHPPAADAFGMTVVEAGSRGAPSFVADGGRVGATALLGPAGGACLADFGQPAAALAAQVDTLLADRAGLADVGARARVAAGGWDEAAAGAALEAVVVGVVGGVGEGA